LRLGDIGEFGLIEHIEGILPRPPAEVLVGIGDDAAVWRCGGRLAIATTDTLVENIHFRRDLTSWYEIGWKSIAANFSDIASMGGVAKYVLIAVGLPDDIRVESVADLYRGIADICLKFGAFVVGGDTVASPSGVVVNVTVFGESSEDDDSVDTQGSPRLMLRSTASAGDTVGVTGFLGSSAAGLETLLNKALVAPGDANLLRKAHSYPIPRLVEGRRLASLGVKACMDISDGLAGDLKKICDRSAVGAVIRIDELPIHEAVRAVFHERAVDLALYGGEDYELLFCAPRETIALAQSTFAREGLAPITVIGDIVAKPVAEVIIRTSDGTQTIAQKGSYDHFARPAGD
jgi:thiamine-monophosphate kinase